ncbi:hypothetical protein ACRE_048970 [Hapsidospora chrysogenum ATCC 11550]|uniref:AGC-kinase C-terminal domain-containing protein n=1 Tax=Hapsidospora chrysogenum (strain ATCC 11550 / CBS 779.69 / DSM 880 / IAM 14645 / JCM 23072 / IMI 49137) TaxID=857340 RepID=A0A086T4N5_HAPC1|nr:hypothetical protein ACRE_048970 [Hapsidospora chrysogenum ATCC 11550]
MLSHLRFHRRAPAGPSTPSSPAEAGDSHQLRDHQQRQQTHDQDGRQPTEPLSAATSLHHPQAQPSDKIAAPSTFPSPGDGFSSLPPTLPPIARVASPEPPHEPRTYPDRRPEPELDPRPPPAAPANTQQRHVDGVAHPPDSRPAHQPHTQYSPYNMDSGFIGGVALQNYRRGLQTQRSSGRDDGDNYATLGRGERPAPRKRPVPAPIDTTTPARPPPQVLSQPHTYKSASSSFVTPTDLQKQSSSSTSTSSSTTGPTGRRPPGTRMVTEPSTMPSSTSHAEPQKTKKGLPFLKKPMSTLLMRRRHGQAATEYQPQPLYTEPDEPAYDPRIRGTRVHDFSAPRRTDYRTGNKSIPGSSGQSHSSQQEPLRRDPSAAPDGSAPTPYPEVGGQPSETTLAESSNISAPPHLAAAGSMSDNVDNATIPARVVSQRRPALPQTDGSGISVKSHASSSSRYSDASTAAPSRATDSGKGVARSRNISLSSDVSAMSKPSALPKYMKSTSSRFSFDMVGATKQEKLLEERHRQREAEKKVTEDTRPRDSRFDDFDEDSFDYDAMMDDDGLEERIPGVNADYDEEDDFYCEEDIDDPDNDQENFAGFAFQRSNGTSPLPTSNSWAGDAAQEAEASAVISPPKGSPFLQESLLSPPGREHFHGQQQSPGALPAGLGIQDVGVQAPQEQPVCPNKMSVEDEDLYFDDGMADEFAEDLARSPSIDGTPFDESIFDNNDTDQYGRPIAGAFAQAQSERQATLKGSVKRESDMTSRFSGQSEVTRSTAHTSFGPPAQQKEEAAVGGPQGLSAALNSFTLESSGPTAAYQAALAAAAHKAAASGKFEWDSSGPNPQDDDGGSPVEESTWQPIKDQESDEYEFGYENMDDFELDDDAIIAEANASALASDSDGWYGEEFGFYSSPANQHHGSRDPGSSTDDSFQYANGGFFGPKGMDGVNRTKSGRVVSREPNLTPITERSEYSNRNSVMSMAMPPHGFGTPIQSPGLAQLAMMGDQGDEMSLSSLLRLRSKAWGGSQASLVSSKDGSPKSDRGDSPYGPWSFGGWPGNPNGSLHHAWKGSVYSGGTGYESDAGSAAGSPTVTMSMSTSAPVGLEQGMLHAGANSARLSAASQPEQLQTSNLPGGGADQGSNPVSATSATSPASLHRRPGAGHRHNNSSDSISYCKEEESGETRWVLERRRVDESGQVEMEREVVEGGRI